MFTHLGLAGVSNITNRTDPVGLRSRVFVGNLNTVHMTKAELESMFAKYGAVIVISVHKGYAFVQYANETSARDAVNGEDSKLYYGMASDVTIASEPKNRKRSRFNTSTNLSHTSNLLNCSAIPDLTLQAQAALTNLANSQVLSSFQQLGLESLIGQPNIAQLAAAANSVLTSATGGPYGALNLLTNSTIQSNVIPRFKQTRVSNSQHSSVSSFHQLSSSAKRTRLDAMNNMHAGSSQLPSGARCQNLVSLVSPETSLAKSNQQKQASSPGRRPISDPSERPVDAARVARGDTKTRQNETAIVTSKVPTGLAQAQEKSSSLSLKSVDSTNGSFSGSSRASSEDILICGSCRRMFDQVDDLISHKMAGCSLSHVPCESCRCRLDEPERLECAYCGALFPTAWQLMHHCHNDHGLTIYALPSPRHSPASSTSTEPKTIKRELVDEGATNVVSDEQDKTQGQASSDWEGDADNYADVVDERAGKQSPVGTPTRGAEDQSEQQHESPGAEDASPEAHSHQRRVRGGEYGRHEIEPDEDEEEEEEEDDNVVVRV